MELEDFLKEGERYPHGWDEKNWEQQMEEHPFFMREQPKAGEMSPLVEALAQVKYDEKLNSKRDLAINYKDDGNNNFKMKKYKWAISCYSKGLEIGCDDPEVITSLYNNRSAAQFYLSNYRSALNDALKAIEIKPSHVKATIRAAQCYFQLGLYRECIDFCKNSPLEDKLKDWLDKSTSEAKKTSRDERKTQAEKRKREEQESSVINTVEKKGIKYHGSLFHSTHPATEGHYVHLNIKGELVWPVIFIYPEHGQTDFIEEFEENQSFLQHLLEMFPCNEDHPPWDKAKRYQPNKVKICFQNSSDSNEWISLSPRKKLIDALVHPKYTVLHSVPTFVVAPN